MFGKKVKNNGKIDCELTQKEHDLIEKIRMDIEPEDAVLDCIDYLDTVPVQAVFDCIETRRDWLHTIIGSASILLEPCIDHFECKIFDEVDTVYDEETDSVVCDEECPLKCRRYLSEF